MNLIFCMLIVLLSAAIGRLLSARLAERLAMLRDFQTVFTQLSDKVVGLNLEVEKALESCPPDGMGCVLRQCAADLRQTPQEPLSRLWRRRFSQMENGGLTKNDRLLLIEGGAAVEALCMNPSEKQAGLYLKRLAAYMAEAEAEKAKKSRLYNTTGVLAGLLIALLVI